jgi:hypothetical protein
MAPVAAARGVALARWLAATFFAALLCATPGDANSVCRCNCCQANSGCLLANSTFVINSCADCTKDICVVRYDECRDAKSDVDTLCINRSAIWNRFSVFIFLAVVALLLVLSVLKNHVPLLKRVLPAGLPGVPTSSLPPQRR